MTETENPTPNPDFEAAVQEKLRQEQEANNADPVIEVPEESIVVPETEVPVVPDKGPEPASEYLEAKAKFGELYPKWNAMSIEEQESEDGAKLAAELKINHEVILKYEPVLPETPEPEEEKPQHILDQENYETDMKEKEVQAKHQNISTPEHYLGSEKVNPDNPMLEHMKPELYDSNKNKENR